MPTIEKTIEISISPKELANLFFYMDNMQQAQFLNEAGKKMKKEMSELDYGIQVLNIVPNLTPHGILLVKSLNDAIDES